METRLTADGTVVGRYGIIGTNLVIFAAFWAFPSLSAACDRYSSLEGIDTEAGTTWLGRIGTGRVPAELDAMPAMTEQRSVAVRAWHQRQYERAYEAILVAFPEAAGGTRNMGEISLVTK